MRRFLIVLLFFAILAIFLLYYVFASREKIKIEREKEINSTIEEIGTSFYGKDLVIRYISRNLNETYIGGVLYFQNEEEGRKFMDFFLEMVNNSISNKEPIKISDFQGIIASLNYQPGYGLVIRKNNHIIIVSGPNKANLIKVVEWIIKRF